jgi:ketosteroid isomerase-like protein
MTPEDERIAIAADGFEAFNRGDVEAILALADPEVEVYMPAEMPNGGTFHGHDGYLKWVSAWLEAWDEFSVEVIEHEPVGERHVVTPVRQRAVGRGSGIPVEMDVWFVNDVVDGKFVALHLYPTREDALAAIERREQAAG